MKNQTIGVEIEMFHITREDAIRVIGNYFGTVDTIRYEGGCYYKWVCKDTQGRVWTITRDSSIQDSHDYQTELATPILHYDDIETLQEIVRALRKAGARSNPRKGCGVHIHVGADGHTPQSLRNLVNIMASHEHLLISAVNIDDVRRGTFCNVVNPRFLSLVNQSKPATMEAFREAWYKGNGTRDDGAHYNSSRYHMLNLHSTFTKGTIEFRLFQFDNPTHYDDGNVVWGGLHAGKLKAYIQLVLCLSHRAKTTKSASCRPAQTENPAYAMRCWLLRLGMIGDEFKTAREVLTARLPGDCAFRSGVRPSKAPAVAPHDVAIVLNHTA